MCDLQKLSNHLLTVRSSGNDSKNFAWFNEVNISSIDKTLLQTTKSHKQYHDYTP